MDHKTDSSYMKISEERVIPKSDILSLLKTYNCYHEGQSFQLRLREEEDQLIMEGLLNICWGLKRPIRLQMYDENQRFHYNCSTIWTSDLSNRNDQLQLSSTTLPSLESNNNNIPDNHTTSDLTSLVGGAPEEEETPQLLRTQSDASFMSIQRRTQLRSSDDMQRIRRHRFSINGHFYNHKTSVFTPAYGSITNVRINSTKTTQQVLSLLLKKFRVENKEDEFALYLVHESGERTKLKDTEFPLVSRVLHGPCEKIAKIFIMETDLGEEVTYDVAQYINFQLPVLDSFVNKLKEEEEREISKLTKNALKAMIQTQLEDVVQTADCM
ncbi:ras association domain-containing protein 4a isoform X2 [Clupea harengus]|uniref:Ras association domain-containing protein 4a isoform X2 n=1 Tax=Clupea harengus TaxID=7950 RepID=A0A6P8G6S0_CLUHA|nr:ras association domain-containing protein 4a isoform X2 [Clupea harengus]